MYHTLFFTRRHYPFSSSHVVWDSTGPFPKATLMASSLLVATEPRPPWISQSVIGSSRLPAATVTPSLSSNSMHKCAATTSVRYADISYHVLDSVWLLVVLVDNVVRSALW